MTSKNQTTMSSDAIAVVATAAEMAFANLIHAASVSAHAKNGMPLEKHQYLRGAGGAG